MRNMYKLFSHPLLISLFCILLGCNKPEEIIQYGSLYGSVVDSRSSKNINNASVELMPLGLKTITGDDGAFEFIKVEEGVYNIFVTKTGYKDYKSSDIIVKANKDNKPASVLLEKLLPILMVVDDSRQEIDTIIFGTEESDVARTINIFNDGDDVLKWQITKTAKWISEIKPNEGELKPGETQSVVLIIDRSLLAENKNETTLLITSNSGSKQLVVSVTNYSAPIVHIYPAEEIKYKQVSLIGSIIEKGFPEYSIFGFVLSTLQHPTLSNSTHKILIPNKDIAQLEKNGKIKTVFDGLLKNSEYFARAYAINTKDTAYSNEVSFSTLPSVVPQCTIVNIENITAYSVTVNSSVLDDGGEDVENKGVCWSETQNPTKEGVHTLNESSGISFTSELSSLRPNTTYYVRAFAENTLGVGYSKEVSFQTADSLPSVITSSVTNILPNSAAGGGDVISEGGAQVIKKGVCWSSTHAAPTIFDPHSEDGEGRGSFISNISDLEKETRYYVRAYAVNSYGIAYGEQKSFYTISGLPVVSTTPPTSTSSTIITGGNASSDSRFPILTKGICYSQTNQSPTIYDTNISSGGGNGIFNITISSLSPNSTYYIRAYATNPYGTQYGESYTISTKYGQIDVLTNDISNITATSALGGVSVTDVGGATLISCGVCWGITQNPSIGNSFTEGGTQLGTHSCSICDLSPNTRYYVRAYVTTNLGTIYGTQKSFQTLNGLPTVITLQPTSSATTINAGGVISSDGGFPIISRGICYSKTNALPTISDQNIVEGSGMGTFNITVPNLSKNSLYYIRAFATNSIGVSYGTADTISTKNGSITIQTQSITDITSNSAIGGVNVSISGGVELQSCGICWATTRNPTITSDHIEGGAIPGLYSCTMNNLSPNTTYYVRAYAISDMGTTYGAQKTFTTQPVSDFIDLGLPSGTKWRDHNESNRCQYNYFNSGNVPSKVQWDELKNLCTWRWTGSGYMVIGLNGNYIIFPAEGQEYNVVNVWSGGTPYGVGTYGYYWTSDDDPNNYTMSISRSDYAAWALVFNQTNIYFGLEKYTNLLSLRLVQR